MALPGNHAWPLEEVLGWSQLWSEGGGLCHGYWPVSIRHLPTLRVLVISNYSAGSILTRYAVVLGLGSLTRTGPDLCKIALPAYKHQNVILCFSLPGFPSILQIRAKNISDNENSLPALSLLNKITGCNINEINVVYNSLSGIFIHFRHTAICKTSVQYSEPLSRLPFKN